jgi:hypothetical protein
MLIISSLCNYCATVIICFYKQISRSLYSTLLRTLCRRLFNNDHARCSLYNILEMFSFNLLRKLVKSYID